VIWRESLDAFSTLLRGSGESSSRSNLLPAFCFGPIIPYLPAHGGKDHGKTQESPKTGGPGEVQRRR
jgi:hypothetical protein